MTRVSSAALSEIEAAFEEYQRAVLRAGLAQNTEHTYIHYVDQFVRWIKDDFEPGATLRNRR